jgi:hypothetical protein
LAAGNQETPFDQPTAHAVDALARGAQFKEPAAIVALRRRFLEKWSTEEWVAYYNERAAIAQYGGLPRAEAEARAFACCVSQWLFFNPTSSSPDRCLECGSSARVNDPLLAVGIVHPDALAWLHLDCTPAWRAARIAAAVAALAAMNIVAAPGTCSTSKKVTSAPDPSSRSTASKPIELCPSVSS